MTPEVKALVANLESMRKGVLDKLAGLSEADARRSTVPSGTNLAGLLQHLTFVEAKFFGDGKGTRSMTVDPAVTLRSLRAEYQAACKASNEVIARLGDGDAPVSQGGKDRNLRWAILAVLGETSRHAGHADILREQIDGKTGR